jgi:hypothetical protein
MVFFFHIFIREAAAQGSKEGKVNWPEGYVSGTGVGTATPSGSRVKDELRAVRAATVLGQRALLETVKGVKIDSQKRIQDRMAQEDVVNTRIEGAVQGAQIVKQAVRWEGDRPIATVELRLCLGGFGACAPENSVISVLSLDQKSEQPGAPSRRLEDAPAPKQENIPPRMQDVTYDSGKPVTGLVLNLQDMVFERVILPVVITAGDDNAPLTVYSVRSVEPEVIRTYGVIRYADSVDQARQIDYLGDNVMIVPVSTVTKDNLIVIGYPAAKLIRETTRHGNDYLRRAKAVIAAR